MDATDAGALYHASIIAEADAAVGAGRLERPGACATVDNPLCGDRVTVELVVEAGRVAALAHRVRGCILCEAAASLIGRHAPGASAAALDAVRGQVEALLDGNVGDDGLAWPALEMFAPVSRHRGRRDCVLLPFQALGQALDQALGDAAERDPG